MSGEERGKKTIVEIIKMYSPRPTSGYDNSWIKDAMQAYADQQNAALKEAIIELIPMAEQARDNLPVNAHPAVAMLMNKRIERAKKLLDKQPQSESDKTGD